MSDLKQARTLLEAAEKDVSALRGMGDVVVFADEIFGFHVQQAAEKLLKAWLASLGEIYPLSHDLASLMDMLRKRGADVFRFDGLVDYTGYAVRLRYTSADTDSRPLDRGKALAQTEALLEIVGQRLAELDVR